MEKVLSKDSIFNQPNGVFGMAVYTFLVIMGKSTMIVTVRSRQIEVTEINTK